MNPGDHSPSMDLIKKESLDEIRDLRMEYLESLLEPPELYMMMLMKNASTYLIRSKGEDVGYAVVSDDGTIFEFHVRGGFLSWSRETFQKIIKDLSVKKGYCQSFDHLYLSMCMLHSKEKRVIGYIFRERRSDIDPVRTFDLAERPAEKNDLEIVREHREEIFDDDEVEDIPFYINKGSIRIFEDGDGEFIGYGLINRTIEDMNWFDVGMYVKEEHRGKGIGTHIISRMIEICDSNGWRPIAGCSIENEGSLRTLQKAGFVSRYVMMEFFFQ
jgi:GNAT superfamily N-acetyltransferase